MLSNVGGCSAGHVHILGSSDGVCPGGGYSQDQWGHAYSERRCPFPRSGSAQPLEEHLLWGRCWWHKMLWRDGAHTGQDPGTWWRHSMQTISIWLAIVREIHRSPVDPPRKGPVMIWCFVCCQPEQAVLTIALPIIWDTKTFSVMIYKCGG